MLKIIESYCPTCSVVEYSNVSVDMNGVVNVSFVNKAIVFVKERGNNVIYKITSPLSSCSAICNSNDVSLNKKYKQWKRKMDSSFRRDKFVCYCCGRWRIWWQRWKYFCCTGYGLSGGRGLYGTSNGQTTPSDSYDGTGGSSGAGDDGLLIIIYSVSSAS